MQHQIGFNQSGLKMNYQEVTNIEATGTTAYLKTGNYIKASVKSGETYGLLTLDNTSFIRRGSICVIEYDQIDANNMYTPLILDANVRNGYCTNAYSSQKIGLLPGETVMLIQRTDTDTTVKWSVLGSSINKFSNTNYNIPFDERWYDLAIAGTTSSIIRDNTAPYSSYNIWMMTTGIDSQLCYPVYLSDTVSYSFVLICKAGSNRGQCVFFDNNIAINTAAQCDLYYSSPAWTTRTLPDYTPNYCGNHIIRVTVPSKNASSSDYSNTLLALTIKPNSNTFI
jgi:hypothetical protein